MSLQKNFDDMVERIKMERDSMIRDIEAINQGYSEKESKIRGAFGGVLLSEKITRMNGEKQAETKKAIIYFQCAIVPLLDQLKRKIDLFVRMSCFDDLNELERLSAMPMSEKEFGYIRSKYGNGRNYWNDRCLSGIAHKNGIEATGLTPCVDTMLEVVEELIGQLSVFTECLDNGQERIETVLPDDYLNELSDRFTGKVIQEGR